MTSTETLQALYDSEINFEISTFWDGGFEWKLGDHMNGYEAEGWAKTMADALDQMIRAAIEKWPESLFARNIRVPA